LSSFISSKNNFSVGLDASQRLLHALLLHFIEIIYQKEIIQSQTAKSELTDFTKEVYNYYSSDGRPE